MEMGLLNVGEERGGRRRVDMVLFLDSWFEMRFHVFASLASACTRRGDIQRSKRLKSSDSVRRARRSAIERPETSVKRSPVVNARRRWRCIAREGTEVYLKREERESRKERA